MTLTAHLQAIADQFKASAPQEAMDAMESSIERTKAGLDPLAVGADAPNFELPDATGGLVRLAEVLATGPVVLNFYRGGWCPFCNLELQALQAALPEFGALDTTLVAISPEIPDSTLSTKEKNELEFHVLSDIGSNVSRQYGVAFTLDDETKELYEGLGLDLPTVNGSGTWELLVPGTYVIDTNGTIAAAFIDADYRRRVEPAVILEALAKLSSKVD